MRTDWDTFQDARQSVLADLQRVSRRANGIAPVVNPEDLGIIRNVIRPALDIQKFGEAGLAFIRRSPYASPAAMYKHAYSWGDWWGDIGSGVKDIGSGLYDVGAGALKTVAAPYYAYKGYQEGGLGGALGGAFTGPAEFAGGIGDIGKGVLSVVPYARRAEANIPLIGRKSIADIGGELLPWMIPGAGPTRAATWGGRALNTARMLGRAGSIAGGIQEGMQTYRQAAQRAQQQAQEIVPNMPAPGFDLDGMKRQLQQAMQAPAPVPGHLSGGWLGAGRM